MGLVILKQNGNGEHILNVPMALLCLVVTILIAAIPAVLAYGALTEKVDNLEKEESSGTETIKNLEVRIIELEKIAAGTEVSLQEIQKDISEIKLDLRKILNSLK